MRRMGLALALLWPVAAMAEPTACEAGARLRYPVAEVLRVEAFQLDIAHFTRPDWTPDSAGYRRAVHEALEGLGPVEADVRLLALIEVTAGRSTFAIETMTTASVSTIYDLALDVLDRRGLEGQAEAMRAARAVYPRWDGTPQDRRRQWIGEDGTVSDPALRARLAALSQDFAAARPRVMEVSEALLAEDPALAARVEAARAAADDGARMQYLIQRIYDCLDLGWWTPREADRALGALAPAPREIVVLQTFMFESLNGGVHQFFWNSSGTLAPDLVRILDRHGLPDHAAALRSGMAQFAWRYPRDTDKRRDIMNGFSEAAHQSLDDLTVWTEDGAIEGLMPRIAREAGIWPD